MLFKTLKVVDFRNIHEINLNMCKNLTVLIGTNGQGKTNIVEALYLLLNGSSFRQGNAKHFIREGKNKSLIAAEVNFEGKTDEISLKFEDGKKICTLNKKKVSSHKLVNLFPYVLFSPESLLAIKGGPDIRRFLVDESLVLLVKESKSLLQRHKKILKSRNSILRDVSMGKREKGLAEPVIESLNHLYLETSTEVSNLRKNTLLTLEPIMRESLRDLIQVDDIHLELEYCVNGNSTRDWDREKFDAAIRYRLEELGSREWTVGTSLVGPHKHDIVFKYQGMDSRYSCSQGEQRVIILAFKIAQIVYYKRIHGSFPMLLLDDVLSELDEKRGAFLIEFLRSCQAQTLMTTTNLPYVKSLKDFVIYNVESGQLREDMETECLKKKMFHPL